MKGIEVSAKKGLLAGVIAFALLFAVAQNCFGGRIEEFSADNVTIDPKGKIENTGKIYKARDKMRVDGMGMNSPKGLVMIMRMDQGVHHALNTEKKIYCEMPIDKEETEKLQKEDMKITDEKILGTEKVSGYNCTKKRIVREVGIIGFKKKITQVAWFSDKFDMPLRTLDPERGSMTELRNIKVGRPANKYFEVPKDYRKVANMMELLAEKDEVDDAQEVDKKAEDSGLKLPFKLPKDLKLPFPSD